MFRNKELEILANSVIHFCENRLKELDNILTLESKNIFTESIKRIKRIKDELKSEKLPNFITSVMQDEIR